MSEKLIKPYEISVWEDKLVQNGDNYDLTERKLAIIGSNTMTGLNKIYDPVFNKKSNGEKTLSFSLKYKYFDPYSENEEVINPFASFLVNERKVKLHYDGEWYELIVKDHSESSEDFTWTYTCTDAFVHELSKVGYNIEFDTELNNNQGTAKELAEETLKNTDWKVGDSDNLQQLIEEPIYKGTLISTEQVNIIDTRNNSSVVFEPGTEIYLFYSYVANKNGKFVQFIVRDGRKYTIDEKNVITDTNYRITTELIYKNDAFYTKDGEFAVVIWDSIDTYYQANRLAYNQKTTYDSVTGHTVDRYKFGDGREVYKYSESVYTTSNVITNFISNSDNFNILDDGTVRGWNPYVESTEPTNIKKLELVTYPELDKNKALADIDKLSQVEGYLKTEFTGPLTENYCNALYNDGFKDNASFIESIAAGDEFVFRWRAGQGELGRLQAVEDLGLLIAKYTRDEPKKWGSYYYHIDPNNIVLDIRPGAENVPKELNNIVEGGEIQSIEGHERYVIDNVVQTISTNFLYKNNTDGLLYYWDNKESEFKVKDENYLPYYYTIGMATKSLPASVLTNPNELYGVFIYTTGDETSLVYIQDIQLTRCIRDGNDEPVVAGNIPTATATVVDYYYLKPEEGATDEEVQRYTDLQELEDILGSEIVPIYNENSEKNLSISVSKSNCFDILQTIAETFECWVDLVVEHDDRGYITYTNGIPNKKVYLREYVGKDNYTGFKYGINIDSIERTVNSDEIVTKLIVDQSQSEYVDAGYVSIANAPSNQSGESYILNFEYYYNQGLLDRDTVEKDKVNFIEAVKQINVALQEKEEERRNLEDALLKLDSNRTVYTELIESSKDKQLQALEDFEYLADMTYGTYMILHNEGLITEDQEKEIFEEENILEVLGTLYMSSSTINNYSGILSNTEAEYWEVRNKLRGSESYILKMWSAKDVYNQTHVYVELDDYLIGLQVVVGNDEVNAQESTISRKYFDININSDYSKAGSLIVGQSMVGYEDGASEMVTVTAPEGFYFILGKEEIGSSYTYAAGDVTTLKVVTGESIIGIEDEINELLDEKKRLVNAFHNKYNRFISEGTWNSTDYIDPELYYLDALQVSNTSAQPTVSYTINVVEVSQLEGLEHYSFDAGDKTYIEDTEFFGWANINVGTTEEPKFVLTPAREEVIISEVEWHLDSPEENVITVQNYKTRFEDLFQRISATVQTVQYNEATYAKMSTLLDANGTINENVLVDSLQRIAGKKYSLTTDGSVLIDGDCILVQNLTETNKRVIITSEGIRVSSDGGRNWATAIDGHGINVGTVYTGKLNTDQVIIGSEANPSFRWDKSGISAYKSDAEIFVKTDDTAIDSEKTYYIYDSITGEYNEVENPIPENLENYYEKQTGYDLKTFVRYDQYGLYGIKNNGSFLAQSLEDVKDKAHFAVTWDGFFIKNSYPGGGRVEITSDNDFRVLNTVNNQEQEKIKIGALEWGKNGTIPITSPDAPGATEAPTLYGIRINNNAGQTVMKTGDDGNLEITGTIYANAGEIGGMSVNNDRLRMDHIVFKPGTGIYSDWGDSSVNPFIISDKDGSATFNNVIVRGSIKTSVFEYEEIQAVGGAFMFRPSTAIKTVVLDNNDLVITVEKPLILRDGAWYKLSNYNSDNSIDADELTTYGLTHVYQLSKITENEETEIRLIGGAAILQTINIDDVPGGSIIDMGFEPNTYRPIKLIAEASPIALKLYELVNEEYILTEDVTVDSNKTYYKEWYQEGINNYGIGINSSDNYINLPPRAISLFETVVHSDQDPKISYKYQGILGTLPDERLNNLSVNASIYQNMRGTQGIYTDNMYIGDNSQFIAFYEDEHGNKQLKIKANQVVYEVTDDQGNPQWHDVAEIETEGVPGPAGQDAIQVIIDSSAGDIFKNREISSVLTCTVYAGTRDITNQVTSFTWQKKNSDGTIDTSWSRLAAGRSITIGPNDINSKAIFICTVEF